MPRTVSTFLKQSLAISLGGPLVGLLLFIVLRPGLLGLAALTFTMPILVLGAWYVGSVPAFLTGIVLFYARLHLGKVFTAFVTALAAAGFAAIWAFAVFPGPASPPSLRAVIVIVSVVASFAFSVPRWDAR